MDMLHGGECLPCAADYFSNGYDVAVCQLCSAGGVTVTEARTQQIQCCMLLTFKVNSMLAML